MRYCLALSIASFSAGCAEPSNETASEPVGRAASAISVEQAIDTSCSTLSVKGLSEQIIAQANCFEPGAFSEVPAQPNLTMADTVFPYLEEPARDAFVAAVSAHPNLNLTVNSMLRTVAQQLLLYRWYQQGKCGIGLAATPGTSNHETGLAFDASQYDAWRPFFEAEGFSWLGSSDPVHFDYAGPDAVDHKGLDVLAFQTLWNLNHPDDVIAADGEYGPQTEARLLASPAEGFARPVLCEAEPSDFADIYLAVDFEADDAFADGASAGVADLFEGETETLTVRLENKGSIKADSVSIAIELDSTFFSAAAYAITHAPSADGPFEPDPANALPQNPKGETLPSKLVLALGPMEAGEHKQITVLITPLAYSVEEAAARKVKTWITQVDALYSQDSFEGEVVNVDDSQTFGGGRLQLEEQADIYSRSHWEWESDRVEGATGSAEMTISPSAGSLHLEGGTGMAMLSLPSIDLPAGEARAVELRGERIGGEGPALLLVRRGDEPFEQAERYPLELTAGGAFRELSIEVGTGPIRGLAIVPFETQSGAADLDFVGIVPGGVYTDESGDGCECNSRASTRPPGGLATVAFFIAIALRRRAARS